MNTTTTILTLNTSMHGEDASSSRLAAELTAKLLASQPYAELIERDLAAQPVPHLTAERFAAFLAKPEQRSAAQREVAAYSDALIDELQRADTLVLGLPMYNFGIPSTLKSYFDHVARAGVTFKYTETGPVGLLKNKKAFVIATRGGLYAGTARDTQSAYLRDFLAFLGITEVEFVYAEGMAMGQRDQALASATASIERLAQIARLAA
jgi:FMN-dependent NADH-azoreductase